MANRKKNFLFLQFWGSHGFNIDGSELIATPYYDPEENFYELIPVEFLIRDCAKGLYNAYFLVFFAACREVR